MKNIFYFILKARSHRKVKEILHHSNAAYINPNYNWKNEVTQIRTTQKKMLQRCIFYSMAKDPDSSNGVKIEQKLLLWIFSTKKCLIFL